MKENFSIIRVRETIKTENQAAAKKFYTLYERAIDLGAHPNELAVICNLRTVERGEWRNIYLHTDDTELEIALKSTAQTGVCALDILQEVFKERFELLGVRAELEALRKVL